MPTESKPKFRRRSEARPDEILDAALALFVRQGFAQTKVDQIAAEAGLSKGAVYLYFPSKEALLEGLVRRAVAPVAETVVAELSHAEGHPREAILKVTEAIKAAMGNEKTMAVPMLVVREAPSVPSISRIYREAVLMRVLPALASLIERGIERGHIRSVDPEMTVRTLVGPLVAHVILAKVFGIVPARGLALDQLITNHLDIVFRGLAPDHGGAS